MQIAWLKIIAVPEIVGGIFGIAFMVLVLITNPVNILSLIVGVAAAGIYLLSLIAGLALLRNRPLGRPASIIVQAIALPKIISSQVIFMFSFGFDLWIYFWQTAEVSNAGFQLKFLAFNQLFFNIPDAPVGFGISITSCIFLAVLLKHKRRTIVEEPSPPLPPVRWSDQVADDERRSRRHPETLCQKPSDQETSTGG